jgi:8-oxo-dGTP diphosphatase
LKKNYLYSPKILLVIRAIVETDNGQILLLKRNSNRQYNRDKWELPGGKVLNNENMEAALERLLNKECNLFVKILSENYYIHSRVVSENGKYQGYSYFEIALPVRYLTGDIKISEKDHSEIKWEDMDKVLDYDLSLESKKALTKYISESRRRRELNELPSQVIVASRALIQNEEGKYLLLNRSPSETYPNLWELPGGKLTSFESLTEHLVREVLEETGLVVEVTKPNLYVHSFIPKDGKYKGCTFINIINYAKVRSGKLRLDNEHSQYQWVGKDEILNYDLPDYMNLSITELFGKSALA